MKYAIEEGIELIDYESGGKVATEEGELKLKQILREI